MNYYKLEIGEREFDCRLTTRDVVGLEAKLKTNPLNVLMATDEGTLPLTGTLLIFLQYGAKEDGKRLKMDDWYDLYDEYVSEGKSVADLLNVVMEIFKVSGLLPKDPNAEPDIKNEQGK